MMTIIKKLSTSILFLFIGLMFSQNENVKVFDLKTEEPYSLISSNDTFNFPHELNMSIVIHELKDLTFKSNYFYTSLDYIVYSKWDTLYTTVNNKEIDLTPYVDPIAIKSDRSDLTYYLSSKGVLNDSLTIYKHPSFYKNDIYHKWDLKDYPFDTQKLELEFQMMKDTSYATIQNSPYFKSILIDDSQIIDGWTFNGFTTDISYIPEPTFEKIKTNIGDRNQITTKLTYYLNFERDGLFLYFKLFFGTFLSFIISYLVFFIDKKYFETRITLSIGGIFGAVGNRYFVESIMPEVQILTKGDLINNLIIFLIVMNIFIVILQNRKIKNKFIAKNKYPAIFSIITFILLNLIIIFI